MCWALSKGLKILIVDSLNKTSASSCTDLERIADGMEFGIVVDFFFNLPWHNCAWLIYYKNFNKRNCEKFENLVDSYIFASTFRILTALWLYML